MAWSMSGQSLHMVLKRLPSNLLVRRPLGLVGGQIIGHSPCPSRASHQARQCLPFLASGGSAGGSRGFGGGNGSGAGGGNDGSSGDYGHGRWHAPMASLAAGMAMLLNASPVHARGKAQEAVKAPESAADDLSVEKVTEVLWSLAGPILSNLGFSGCVGAAAGMALKKVGQLVACMVGLMFLAVQGLAYTGIVSVNWGRVHGMVLEACDVNKDGVVDEKDFKHATSSTLAALATGVPSVGGFLAGFLWAVRYL